MTRELRIGIALLVALGAVTALLILVGSLGEPRPEVDPLSVDEARRRRRRSGGARSSTSRAGTRSSTVTASVTAAAPIRPWHGSSATAHCAC